MKALNKKERNRAFFKVVGFFMISFIIAIFLGFTTMNMGKLADNKSKEELAKLKAQLKFERETFAPNVGKTVEILGKLPTAEESGENVEVLNQDIGAKLSQTKNQIKEDDSWESKMYKDVIGVLSDLQLAYNAQIDLEHELGNSSEISDKLQECINEKNQIQNQLNVLKAAGISGGGGGGSDTQCKKDLKAAQKKLKQVNLENRALKKEIEKYRNR